MRWIWIDRIIELEPGRRLVAVKNVSLAEDTIHNHFPADAAIGAKALPVMPAPLIIEGMAQAAGILVGHARDFREKVILAKIGKAALAADAPPGVTLRYTAEIQHLDEMGAGTSGLVEMLNHGVDDGFREIGRIDLVFSHVDRNLAGTMFPEHNFVFTESFETLLRSSGVRNADLTSAGR
ncbi:MAG: beta-hydroxyacyl-ACP dehydratase [Planctomycetota bacterium]|nr:beta-hydroxyacyl-ACP dehydratase [Planctomycetota bacterium]